MSAFLHYPIVRGAISGVLAAAVVDFHAFMRFQNIQEAAKYQWGTAAFRWGQGAVSGALAAAGFVAVLG